MPPNYVLCFQILPITVSTAPSEAASPEAPFGRGRTQKRVICNNGREGDLRDSLNMTLGSNTLTKLSKSAFRGNSDTYAGLLARGTYGICQTSTYVQHTWLYIIS